MTAKRSILYLLVIFSLLTSCESNNDIFLHEGELSITKHTKNLSMDLRYFKVDLLLDDPLSEFTYIKIVISSDTVFKENFPYLDRMELLLCVPGLERSIQGKYIIDPGNVTIPCIYDFDFMFDDPALVKFYDNDSIDGWLEITYSDGIYKGSFHFNTKEDFIEASFAGNPAIYDISDEFSPGKCKYCYFISEHFYGNHQGSSTPITREDCAEFPYPASLRILADQRSAIFTPWNNNKDIIKVFIPDSMVVFREGNWFIAKDLPYYLPFRDRTYTIHRIGNDSMIWQYRYYQEVDGSTQPGYQPYILQELHGMILHSPGDS